MPERTLRLGWWLSSEEHDPRHLVEHARLAESVGFETAMVSDHLQPWVRHQGNAAFVWTTLGAIANATETLEVGTGVTAMVHRVNPVTIAHAAATAAVMFEDRFFLGVGTGERLNEQPLGQRWPAVGERLDQLREAIEIIRMLWSGDNVNHRGQYWTVENLRLATRPAFSPPIFVASSGKRSAALAGEVGDGIIGVSPDATIVDTFHGTGGEGKPCFAQLHVSLAETTDAAIDNAWTWWPIGTVPAPLLTEVARPMDFEAIAEAAGRDAFGSSIVCATGAAPIVDAIDRFVGAGYDTIYIHQIGPDQKRLADIAARELLPHYCRGRSGDI